MPRGPLALLTQEWQSISAWLQPAVCLEPERLRDLEASVSRCFYLFTSQQRLHQPPRASCRIPGRGPPWLICTVFVSICVLLNLFLFSSWDLIRAEKWLADKKEEETVGFQRECGGNPPAASSRLRRHAGKWFSVFGPLRGVWMLELFIITFQVYVRSECTLERRSVSWLHINTQHIFLIVHQRRTRRLPTRRTIINVETHPEI